MKEENGIRKELDFHRMHFDSIQALRGIAALFVVLEHIRFLNCGAFGVDIFFCISGFMIMFSTHQNTEHFLVKRLIRILPLYYIMTVGTFLLLVIFPDMFEQSRPEASFLIKSLLFIPFDIGNGSIQPLMRIGWTVNCEVFFYLLFFIALRISHRYRGLICSLLLLAVMGAAHLLPSCPVPLAFYGNPVMAEFIFGMLCYYAARKLYSRYREGKLPGICLPLSALLLFACFIGLLATKPSINILGLRRPFVWGLPASAIVLSAFTAGLFCRKIPASLVRLGNSSFSLYLVHYYPVMLLDRKVFDFSAPAPWSLFGACAAIAVSVALALLCREIMEIRFSGWLRKLLIRQ